MNIFTQLFKLVEMLGIGPTIVVLSLTAFIVFILFFGKKFDSIKKFFTRKKDNYELLILQLEEVRKDIEILIQKQDEVKNLNGNIINLQSYLDELTKKHHDLDIQMMEILTMLRGDFRNRGYRDRD